MAIQKKRSAGSKFQPNQKRKKIKRPREYHSSSSENEDESEDENKIQPQDERKFNNDKEKEDELQSEESIEEDSENDSINSSQADSISDPSENEIITKKPRKRNDPSVFATSISKILGSKLSNSKRVDPVLSRSRDAATAVKEIAEAKLETKAKQKIRDEKKAKLDNGRIKDVLGLQNPEISTQDIMDQEKKYKKIAQRGVVRMFNAIRTAQVMGEQAAKEVNKRGIIGVDQKEQKINEMSKNGFLELIAGGGKS